MIQNHTRRISKRVETQTLNNPHASVEIMAVLLAVIMAVIMAVLLAVIRLLIRAAHAAEFHV
jgi:cell division protein FtsN